MENHAVVSSFGKIARNISDIKVVPSGELLTNQNKKVRYIKDFSELTKDERRLSFKKH